ncbi:MAG: hypothetical protein NWP69_01840, partial [Congregibacter sp.]|nr:hypothetical protein [Congregibacter sp.]
DSESVMWVENSASAIARRLTALLLDTEPKARRLDMHAQWLHTYFDQAGAASILRADIPKLGFLPETSE